MTNNSEELNAEMDHIIKQANDKPRQIPADEMTLLDWFAGMALHGICANPMYYNASYAECAGHAYGQAKFMLEEREDRK